MADKKEEAVVEPMVINKDELKKVRGSSKGNWRMSIVDHLKDNNGVGVIDLVDATHPTGNNSDNEPMTVKQKEHNFASQKTYLADDGYIIKKENGKMWLLTQPSKTKGQFEVIKGQEERVRRLL